jgi:hypothetical protein
VKRRVGFILLACIVASCISSLPYSTDYPLTEETFHSRDRIFDGRIPQGWFCSSEDSLAPALIVWLLKEDYSASINIQELRLDQLTAKRVEKEGIKLLAELSLATRQDSVKEKFTDSLKEFKIRGKEFCSYEIKENGNRTRVVVFSAKGKFYECVALTLKGTWQLQEISRLFTIQQSILASLITR